MKIADKLIWVLLRGRRPHFFPEWMPFGARAVLLCSVAVTVLCSFQPRGLPGLAPTVLHATTAFPKYQYVLGTGPSQFPKKHQLPGEEEDLMRVFILLFNQCESPWREASFEVQKPVQTAPEYIHQSCLQGPSAEVLNICAQ